MFFFCLSVLAKSVIFSTYLRHEVVVLSQSRLLGLQWAPRLYPLVISGQGPDYAAHASAFTWIIMTKLKIISFYSPNNLHKPTIQENVKLITVKSGLCFIEQMYETDRRPHEDHKSQNKTKQPPFLVLGKTARCFEPGIPMSTWKHTWFMYQ